MIKTAQVYDQETLHDVKTIFRVKFQNLMTNMLKISLNLNEEFLACIIVAYNDLALDEDLMVFMIRNRYLDVLKYIFAFDKNYLGIREEEGAVKVSLRNFLM